MNSDDFAARSKMRGGTMKTVLLAEDTPELRELMGNALRKCGYKVVEAKNGMEALRLFNAIPEIQAVVTDLEMPMANGIQLAGAIKEIDPAMPIVMWSGSDDPKLSTVNLFLEKSGGSKPVLAFLDQVFKGAA